MFRRISWRHKIWVQTRRNYNDTDCNISTLFQSHLQTKSITITCQGLLYICKGPMTSSTREKAFHCLHVKTLNYLKCLWNEKLSFKQTPSFKRTLEIICLHLLQFFHISLCSRDILVLTMAYKIFWSNYDVCSVYRELENYVYFLFNSTN